jgi:hypothetical protein
MPAGDRELSHSQSLTPVRVSRWIRDRVRGDRRATVVAVQRRACHLALAGGALVIVSRPGVPLAPNALTVDLAPHVGLDAQGFRVGQAVRFDQGPGSGDDVTWLVDVRGASTWEPRPDVRPIPSRDLIARMRAIRATVVAEGAGESLLPLLWMAEGDAPGPGAGVVRIARPAARRLCDAASRRDAHALADGARGLAGLGPGLTPSGDDLLAGFAAAWALVGEALGIDRATRTRVTAAIRAGAAPGASPLGRAWVGHACRGELLEPMTGLVALLLAPGPRDLEAATRGALRVGASSGTDWLVGFLLGSDALLAAPRRGRPW